MNCTQANAFILFFQGGCEMGPPFYDVKSVWRGSFCENQGVGVGSWSRPESEVLAGVGI